MDAATAAAALLDGDDQRQGRVLLLGELVSAMDVYHRGAAVVSRVVETSMSSSSPSTCAFFSNEATILIILACVSNLAFCLHATTRCLISCLACRRDFKEWAQP
uniref:Uncharacterized protein n=1 Tax=Oryza barthii TaxID=65489 RepID=A0A0D3GZ19_9ORYZ